MTGMWRNLSKDEEEEFRQWARDNWKSKTEPNLLWHPIIKEEWSKLDEKYVKGVN